MNIEAIFHDITLAVSCRVHGCTGIEIGKRIVFFYNDDERVTWLAEPGDFDIMLDAAESLCDCPLN